jgi:two-component system phosphate regulon sensor histidine kinase PhoR
MTPKSDADRIPAPFIASGGAAIDPEIEAMMPRLRRCKQTLKRDAATPADLVEDCLCRALGEAGLPEPGARGGTLSGPGAILPAGPVTAATGSSEVADADFCATLLAMAGHDLRQPLQVISAANEILARSLRTDAERLQLARVESATTQLAARLNLLVEALRLREVPNQNRPEPVPVGPVLARLAAEFAEAARLRGIALHVVPARAAVFSQPVLLGGILRNLMRNAIDYTPRGGRVLVGCRRRGREVRIEVRDTGAGIPAGQLTRLFEAFSRADATRPDGLGLGLFIVKRTADFLGHRIEVSSTVGCGSSFVVVADTAQYRSRLSAISDSLI